MIAPAAVETSGLTKRFGATVALDDFSWQVPAGSICGLVGPDGAGKTTTLRLLCGVLRPDAGSASVAGFDVAQAPDEVKLRVGYLAQRFALYTDLTVAENVAFFADAYGVPRAAREARARELLALTRLDGFAGRLAEHLSGGMRQKLSLACALIHWPAVLLLDEPTAGVDPLSRRDLWQLLHRLNRDGLTVVLSTPDMDEAARCHRVAFLAAGRLLAEGTPAALRDRLAGRVLSLHATPLWLARTVAAAIPGVAGVQVLGDRLHLLLAGRNVRPDVVRTAVERAGVAVQAVAPATPAMEDVFVALARGG